VTKISLQISQPRKDEHLAFVSELQEDSPETDALIAALLEAFHTLLRHKLEQKTNPSPEVHHA
jgi:hypothetical protein